MGYSETYDLNGSRIKTTVTSDAIEVEKHLTSFLTPSAKTPEMKVIALDAEWCLFRRPKALISECATLHLCDGNSCLIIQLSYLHAGYGFSSAHKSLLNFLRLPNLTFVGIGIFENLVKLEKQCGFGCRNAVELGPFAASATGKPRLSYCGVDELLFVVNRYDFREHRPLSTDYDWNESVLSKNLAKLATVNVYSYYKIGEALL